MSLLLMASSSPSTGLKLIFILFVIFVVLLISKMAAKSRQYVAKTDHLLCKSCGTAHPTFAHFCRRCGKISPLNPHSKIAKNAVNLSTA